MRLIFLMLTSLLLASSCKSTMAAALRVLITSDSEPVRTLYAAALKSGGAAVSTAPTADANALATVDVVLLHRGGFTPLSPDAQGALAAFSERGGGIVAVHGAVAAGDAAWGKANLGGAWNPESSRRFTSRMMLNVRTDSHPIVRESSSFDVEDETLYDLALAEDVFVLGSAFTPKVTNARNTKRAEQEKQSIKDARASVYDIQPQMWAFEGAKHRAAVFLQGAEGTLHHPSIRSFVLRAVAWTARREPVDGLCSKADLATLRYPPGGPLSPSNAVDQFQMLPGFKATVIASEPLINKPIAAQWDARGRLWIAETPEYPNGRRTLNADAWKEGGVLDPGRYDRPARDRISILEDTDGDGVVDKKTVFHEGLELITGFCMHRDGVIVVAQPNMVWLRDTDGDNKADKEIPLYGGFTPGDTHFVANHFIPAPDGWIYASTGSGATVTKPGTGEILAKTSPGLFRFKADGTAVEQVASQGGNTFGAEVTSDMELWHGKATSGNPLQHVVLPEWVLARAGATAAKSMNSVNPGRTVARTDLPTRAPLMQIDQVGRYSAACSSLVYEGGAWPPEYDGLIFVTEPILDIIHHERLSPVGPTFKGGLVIGNKEWLRSRDHYFTPIDVTIGPDGAMYVLDFYTPVVAHNDTRGPQHSKSGASVRPDREHYFGRIYRIQHDAATKLTVPDLSKANATELVAAFRHPNRVVRFNAIRVLMEKSDTLAAQATPALTSMAANEPFAVARILALWSLHRLGKLPPQTLSAAIRATDVGVRKNALLIAEAGHIALNGSDATAALNDPDARVRLTALRALSGAPLDPEAGPALLAVQSKLDDAWSKAAAAAASANNPGPQLLPLLRGRERVNPNTDLARSLAASVANNGNPSVMLEVAQAAARHATLGAVVLAELSRRPSAPPADTAAVANAMRIVVTSENRALAAAGLPLAVAWGQGTALKAEIAKLVDELLSQSRDISETPEARAASVRSLLGARGAVPNIMPAILAMVRQPQPEAFRRELVAAIVATGEPAVGTTLADVFPNWPTTAREMAFNALVSRPTWTALLLDRLETKKVEPAALGPTLMSRLSSHPDAATSQRARALLSALGSGANPAKDEIINRLLPVVDAPANAAKGKDLFVANCATCHRIVGQGFELGPDLDGIGSHPVAELLVHIIDPNRMVDDEHRTWNITLKDDTQYSALIAGENSASVKIRMAGGVTMDLKTSDITTRTKVANSLMPEGLEALGGESLRDIVGYIQSLAPKPTPSAQTPGTPRR